MILLSNVNIYTEITNIILEKIQEGVLPWEKPWFGGTQAPSSYITGKPYSLLNQMLLGKPGMYITKKKLKDLGGKLRTNAPSHKIVFWKLIHKQKEEKEDIFPILKYFDVYHIDSCENVPIIEQNPSALQESDKYDILEHLQYRYLKKEKIDYNFHPDGAFYAPKIDSIYMPSKIQFSSLESYYSTLYHEIVHSTGHPQRLNRLSKKQIIQSTKYYYYNREELVAELGSSFLLHKYGLKSSSGVEQSASYIKSWSEVFTQNPYIIISAAAKAQKAVEYILNGMEV